MTVTFQGFPAESLTFLKELKQNNNREWFAANKSTYESAIKRPAEAFAKSMATSLEALTGMSHKAKIFRIYRDVRFSKDKTPYNTHLRLSFTPETGLASPPTWMFGVETDHLVLGVGLFGFDKAGLDRFRDRLIEPPGGELATILQDLQSAGLRMGEPELKRIPSGYDKEHERAGMLRHKSLTVWKDYPDARQATKPKVIDECLKTFTDLKPVFDWLLKV